VLPGSNLFIQTKRHGKIPGVISTIPPHLLILMDASKATDIEDLVIDVGMEADQIKDKIQPGDFAYYADEVFEMKENLLCGKAMDDRACFVCILRALELLADKQLNCDIVVAGTTKEEIGFHGAIMTGYRNPSDLAIAVDVCHAKTGDTQIADNVYDFGGGPVISFGSNSMPGVAKTLVQIAKDAGIPFQLSATPEYSGTNAWVYQHSGTGMRVAIILLPLKYMHTPVEMICMEDVENLSRLIAEFALRFHNTAEVIK
jgi:endoglucanase